MPWYLNGQNSKPTDDGSRSPKWSQPPDLGETQSVEPPDKAWSDWRQVVGSDIEQRSEMEADFGQATGQYPAGEIDQSWVREPYNIPQENYDGNSNLFPKRKNSKSPVPANSPNFYEGVPLDSKVVL